MVVVVGAGASADAANGSGLVVPQLRPPLAREIFQDRPVFRDTLDRYPGAKRLQSGILGPRSQHGDEFDLEEALEKLRLAERTARAFFEIPPFLSDLFKLISASYLSYPETYLTLAERLAEEHEVAFVSLNYDTLLEQAVERAYSVEPIAGLDDYVGVGRPLIVKPHGSIDWWRRNKLRVNSFDELISSLAAGLQLGEVEFHRGRMSANEMTIGSGTPRGQTGSDRRLYPALTAPLAEKTLSQILCPPSHLEALAEFQRRCTKYLFVGTSGWDSHVLKLLNEGAVSGSKALCVGGWAPMVDRREQENRAEFQARQRQDRGNAERQADAAWGRIGNEMKQVDCRSDPFKQGFLAFSVSNALEEFLSS